YSTSRAEAAIAQKQTNLIAEYFNRIDKEVVKIVNENPLPVLIATDESNYSEYLKIADRKEIYLEQVLAGNRLEEKAPQIVNAAWEMVKEYAVANNNTRKLELKNAVSSGKFMSDVNDIWRAL